jgi:hypothetical protein
MNWTWLARGNIYGKASLAQSVERQTLNLKVAGSTPAWGFDFCFLGFVISKRFCFTALCCDVGLYFVR